MEVDAGYLIVREDGKPGGNFLYYCSLGIFICRRYIEGRYIIV